MKPLVCLLVVDHGPESPTIDCPAEILETGDKNLRLGPKLTISKKSPISILLL